MGTTVHVVARLCMALARATTTLRFSGPLPKALIRDRCLLPAAHWSTTPHRHPVHPWQKANRQQKGINTATLRLMAVGNTSQGEETATLALGCFWEPDRTFSA